MANDDNVQVITVDGQELEDAKALVEMLVKTLGWAHAYLRLRTCAGLMEDVEAQKREQHVG